MPSLSVTKTFIFVLAACGVLFLVSSLRLLDKLPVPDANGGGRGLDPRPPPQTQPDIAVSALELELDEVQKTESKSRQQWQWLWRRNDTLFHNLGQTMATRLCAAKSLAGLSSAYVSAQCNKLPRLSKHASKSLLCSGVVMMYWPAASGMQNRQSCGPMGLHYLPYTLNRELGCEAAYMHTVSRVWDVKNVFPLGVPALPPGRADLVNVASFAIEHESDGILVIPDVLTPVPLPWSEKLRTVRWMLGWHHGIHRNARVFSHSHYVSNIGPSITATLWQHPPPPMYLEHVRQHGVDLSKKEDLVLIDGDSGIDVRRVQEALKKRVEVVELKGFDTDQVIDLYQRAKVTMDAKMPGLEMINIEGKAFECVAMLGNHMVGQDLHDFSSSAIPDELRFDVNCFDEMVDKIQSAVERYEKHRIAQESWRRDIMTNMDFRWVRDIETSFMGQSVLFRTVAVTHSEQRAVIPWMLAVMNAFPLARFDVVVPLKNEFEREFEGPLVTLRGFDKAVINPAFGEFRDPKVDRRLIEASDSDGDGYGGLYYDLMRKTPPNYNGNMYTVYSSVHALFLGRDVLNAHAEAVESGSCVGASMPSSPIVFCSTGEKGGDIQGQVAVDADADAGGLPLDILSVKDSAGCDGATLHLTHEWSMRIRASDAVRAPLVEALDSLVNGAPWRMVEVFFSCAYQALRDLR